MPVFPRLSSCTGRSTEEDQTKRVDRRSFSTPSLPAQKAKRPAKGLSNPWPQELCDSSWHVGPSDSPSSCSSSSVRRIVGARSSNASDASSTSSHRQAISKPGSPSRRRQGNNLLLSKEADFRLAGLDCLKNVIAPAVSSTRPVDSPPFKDRAAEPLEPALQRPGTDYVERATTSTQERPDRRWRVFSRHELPRPLSAMITEVEEDRPCSQQLPDNRFQTQFKRSVSTPNGPRVKAAEEEEVEPSICANQPRHTISSPSSRSRMGLGSKQPEVAPESEKTESYREKICKELIEKAGGCREAFNRLDLTGSGHICSRDFADGVGRIGVDWQAITGYRKSRDLFKLFEKRKAGLIEYNDLFPIEAKICDVKAGERMATPEFCKAWSRQNPVYDLDRQCRTDDKLETYREERGTRLDAAKWMTACLRQFKSKGTADKHCWSKSAPHLLPLDSCRQKPLQVAQCFENDHLIRLAARLESINDRRISAM